MFDSLTDLFKTENSEENLTQFANQEITHHNYRSCFQIGFRKILLSQNKKNGENKNEKLEGWKYINSVKSFVDNLISDRLFLELLNLNWALPETRDILKLIIWILDNQQEKDFTMAVKQHVTEKVEKTDISDFNHIITIIELLLNKQSTCPTSCEMINICKMIFIHLMKLQIPREEMGIKSILEDLTRIGIFLKLTGSNPEYGPQIRNMCLRNLYKVITATDSEASPAVAIVLELVGESEIAEAVNFILSDDLNGDAIKRGFITLCKWLYSAKFSTKLHIWIIEIMNGLRDREKYDLLLEMTLEVIEKLFKALILPSYLSSVAPVVLCMLASVRHTPVVFHKIVPRVPHILKSLNKSSLQPGQHKTTQALVDTISALILHFPNESLYKEIEQELENFSKSSDFRSTLEVTQWTDTSEIYYVNKNVRVGLVNLGNTCYMNSVLQALVMTRHFTREFLLTNCRAPLLVKVQQLLALLLHSKRSELTPRAIFAVRPPDFLSGFQQDSSEYLGFLLDKLHEQEYALIKNTSEPNDNERMEVDGGAQQETSIKRWPTQESLSDDLAVPDSQSESSDSGIAISSSSTSSSNNSPLHSVTQMNESDMKVVVAKTETRTKSPPPQRLTAIQKTFNGKICTTYQCMTCQSKSSNIDSFRDLQLSFPENNSINTNDTTNEDDDDIVDKNNYSVQNLLDFYCSSEKLDGDNQYFCDHCKNLCDGERSINIVSPPQTLILILKHFRYDQRHHTRAKLMHKVFHDETVTLNILSASKKEIKSVEYELYAAVVHSGVSMDSGHYYTYASDDISRWYKFNDNIVTNSSLNELHNLSSPNTPYILFYQMKSTTVSLSSQKKMLKINCDNLMLLSNDIASNAIDAEGSIKKKPCLADARIITPICDLPEFDELPPQLRDYVHNDNILFAEEMRSIKNKMQHHINKNSSALGRKPNRDSDDDPPNSCGGNQFATANPYIY